MFTDVQRVLEHLNKIKLNNFKCIFENVQMFTDQVKTYTFLPKKFNYSSNVQMFKCSPRRGISEMNISGNRPPGLRTPEGWTFLPGGSAPQKKYTIISTGRRQKEMELKQYGY
jgi:hypothetical protein